MNSFVISCVLAVTIIAAYVHAAPPGEKKSYDDIMGVKFTNKESFDQFYKMLNKFKTDKNTKAQFAKSVFNKPSLNHLNTASNEFKNLCGSIYQKKKNGQPPNGKDSELAYRTLCEATKEIYATYKNRLVGMDNNFPKIKLTDLFRVDPIKCVCLLATKRLGVEEAIEEITGPFEVSREEAALRHFIVEQEDGEGTSDCFHFFRALVK